MIRSSSSSSDCLPMRPLVMLPNDHVLALLHALLLGGAGAGGGADWRASNPLAAAAVVPPLCSAVVDAFGDVAAAAALSEVKLVSLRAFLSRVRRDLYPALPIESGYNLVRLLARAGEVAFLESPDDDVDEDGDAMIVGDCGGRRQMTAARYWWLTAMTSMMITTC